MARSAGRAEGEAASRRNTLYVAVPANAPGVSVVGDWDPLGMRGTVSRTLLFKDVFVPEEAMLMPHGVYFQAASRWPHMFLTLSPTYMGLAQAAYDFTVAYLRGEVAGTPVKRRMFPTKQIAVAEMRIMLEQTRAIWFQSITEARANPTKDQVLRAYAGGSAFQGVRGVAPAVVAGIEQRRPQFALLLKQAQHLFDDAGVVHCIGFEVGEIDRTRDIPHRHDHALFSRLRKNRD